MPEGSACQLPGRVARTEYKFGETGAISIAGALKYNSILTSLALQGSSACHKYILYSYLYSYFRAHVCGRRTISKYLRNLSTTANNIGAAGIASLAEVLKSNSALVSVDVTNTKRTVVIGPRTRGVRGDATILETLSDMLKLNPVLRTFKGVNVDFLRVGLQCQYRMPLVRLVVRTRVLCQAGRCRAAGARGEMVAWLCERAPLWVVVHVCMLVRGK